MTGAIAIQCATGGRQEAIAIADALVERRLAACVQLMPIESTYRWDGAVQHDAEVLLVAKTMLDRFDAVAACIRALHSYDVPEIVAVPIVAADTTYLAWVEAEVAVSAGSAVQD